MAGEPSSSHACVADVSLAASNERAWDQLMEWVALYIPTYGTSVVLHVAVGLLMAFAITWPGRAASEPFRPVTGGIVPIRRPVKTKRRDVRETPKSRGRLKLQPSSLVREPTKNRVPDVATNYLQTLDVIGIGGGGYEMGGLEGLDTEGTIFGWPQDLDGEPAAKVVYVVDRSGSMTDSICFVKAELRRSIMELGEEVEFHVIFYSSGPPVEMPTRRLVRATERNKRLAGEFIDPVVPAGETDPSKALQRAFAVRPELIYLLTDGEFDRGVIDLVKRLNAGGRTRVFTIGFLYTYPGTPAEGVLKQISRDSGGEYKFVSERDLESILAGA